MDTVYPTYEHDPAITALSSLQSAMSDLVQPRYEDWNDEGGYPYIDTCAQAIADHCTHILDVHDSLPRLLDLKIERVRKCALAMRDPYELHMVDGRRVSLWERYVRLRDAVSATYREWVKQYRLGRHYRGEITITPKKSGVSVEKLDFRNIETYTIVTNEGYK